MSKPRHDPPPRHGRPMLPWLVPLGCAACLATASSVLWAQTPPIVLERAPQPAPVVETLPPLVPQLPVARPVLHLPVPADTAWTPPLMVPAPRPPAPLPSQPVRHLQAPDLVVLPERKLVPVSLDAVLRLAQDQNSNIRLAREKLEEAHAEHELAGKRWIPDFTVGAGFWRHEGGIQDFDGRLLDSSFGSVLGGVEMRGKIDIREAIFTRLDAERKIWQQQGELSRFTSEQLLDAATTYVDWMAAHSAGAIAREAEAKLTELLEQARNLAKVDPGVQVEVARVESELGAQRILTRRLQEGAASAAAKLAYLLNLDPSCELVPVERQLVPFRLADFPATSAALVELALRSGPGIRELEGILAILEESRQQRLSPMHLMPIFEMRMTEGMFGAGPGARLDWENRWDLGIQARWNLTEFLGSKQRKRLADLKIQQAHTSYHDLRGKLSLGIQEAVEAQRSGQEQMALAAKQIQHAEQAYHLSDMRLKQSIKGRSPSEVLLAIRALVGARLSYLHAVRDLDKAQVRIFVFTGGAAP